MARRADDDASRRVEQGGLFDDPSAGGGAGGEPPSDGAAGAVRDARGTRDPAAGAGASAPAGHADAGPAAAPRRRVIVIVDGHALAYRSYFGVRDLSTSRGRPTNAVYGFTRTLLKILRDEERGDATVVAFDAPAPTFRHERFEAYKAGRAPTPPDLPQQIAVVKRLLDLLGVPRIEVPGLEADDLIGTVARRGEELGYDVAIVTSDSDALQLVSEHVRVRSPDRPEPLGPAEVEERYGVRPEQWVDYRSLTGDASDNIPGVKGVGPVAARRVLQRYGSLDAALEAGDALEPAALAARLAGAREQLEASRELARIVTDAAIDVDPAAWALRERDDEALSALLRELEFGSVLHELGLAAGRSYADAPWEALPERAAVGFVLDDERATNARIVEVARAADGKVARADDAATWRETLGRLETVTAADAKALVVAARRDGLELRPGDDPLLMAYLLDPSGASPEALARRHGAGEWGPDARARASVTAELLRLLGPRLVGEQRRVYETLERPLQAVLADMELAGVRLDTDLLRRQSDALGGRLSELEARVRDIAGNPLFNVNSRDQVAWLLFEKLGLEAGRRTATGKRSTAVGALEHLAGEHEAVALIVEHRELSKLRSTYLDPLPRLVDPVSGRLHTTFNQTVVATGRLSSTNPNLQNIPVRTDLGREIRRAFVAGEGCVLLVADYSQIELRVLAHVAGEPALIDAFRRGEDVHRRTAAEVFGVAPDAVDAAQRRAAKVINFGVLYGMGPRRLAHDLDIGVREADAFITTYFERYPLVGAYIERTLGACRERGWVETLLGRRRLIPDILSPNRQAREYAERTAYNMPIQGTAADIMKLAMLGLAAALEPLGGRLLLQVHDEVVVEVPAEAAAPAAALTARVMAGAFELDVPLLADVGTGPNWLEAK